MSDLYCNNCGKKGHLYNQCKIPITSIGVVAFRIKNKQIEFLMIRRKETLGFIDFMRGKYSVHNKNYIKNMITQMTNKEKTLLKTKTFQELWEKIWGSNNISNQYKNEEVTSKEKFYLLKNGVSHNDVSFSLDSIIDESYNEQCWEEQEWGFPKGRRNFQEKDFDCAIREFTEETGYPKRLIYNIKNIYPFEEIFTGSNYKSYKHKYYIAYMKAEETNNTSKFQKSEVDKMEWKSFDDCLSTIRSYNLEKKRILTNIYNTLKNYPLLYLNV